ncbi:MAG: hypothetical protein P8P37_01735 [Candidatus Marinimicrobia bacterium]|nr:hypothetical protein [Candidatus Neomarinimicrobiota bacterium]
MESRFKKYKSMKDLHIALKYIQGKLRDNEQITITKKDFNIKLIKANNDMVNGLVENVDANPIPSSLIDGIDVEMQRQMYD